MDLLELLTVGMDRNASDIHFTVGIPPTYRIDGGLVSTLERSLTQEDTAYLVKQVLGERRMKTLDEIGELDFSYVHTGRRQVQGQCLQAKRQLCHRF